ncbi:MAG: hypothetical protein WAV28_03605 [Sedimentisphaerales bacterium]|jgi:hypothetical protein
MNRLFWFLDLLAIAVSAGCNSDIVTTNRLKELTNKCVYIAPLESEDPQVGKVIRDVIEKEFIRKKIELCDPNTATVFISGATFLTAKSTSSGTFLSTSSTSSQAVESVSLVAKNIDGEVLLSASYDNKDRQSASQLAKEFGSALADKLK